MSNDWYLASEIVPEPKVPVIAICKNFDPLAPKVEYWSLTAVIYSKHVNDYIFVDDHRVAREVIYWRYITDDLLPSDSPELWKGWIW